MQVSSTAGGLAFSDRAGTANVLIDWEVRSIECGCRDIVADQFGRDPNFHFTGSDRSVIYPSEVYCNEVLNEEPNATAAAFARARVGPQNFCELTYECVDEECQFKHLLFQTDRPPFCHCVEEGDDNWLIECQIYFVDCCCDPDPELDAGSGDGGSDGGRDGGGGSDGGDGGSDGGDDAGSSGGHGGPPTLGARSGGT